MSDTACKYCGTELKFTSLGEVCPNERCTYVDGFYSGPREPRPTPERTYTEAAITEASIFCLGCAKKERELYR